MAVRVLYLAPFDLTQPAGHTSHVLATGCPDAIAGTVRFVAVPASHRPGLQSISFGAASAAVLAREIVRRRPDAVYTRYFRSASLPILTARAARIPAVVEVNSDTANERRANRRGRLVSAVEVAEERIIYEAAGAIVCVTEAIADRVASVAPSASGKTSVIWNGVDTELYRPLERTACAEKHGLDPQRKRVVFTGALQLWQGVPDLLTATARIARQRSDTDLLLVGDGPLRAEIEDGARSVGIEDRVRVTGFVSEETAAELIGASDVCAAPYNTDAIGEAVLDKARRGALMRGSPLKIYAYMACGRPVVASHFLEAGEHLEAVGAGVAVPPESPESLAGAILGLLADPTAAQALGERGREVAVARHSWSGVVDRYLRCVERVAAKRSMGTWIS